MGLKFHSLDQRTRALMIEEIEIDARAGKLYFSSYLSETGRADWHQLLRQAAENGSDDSFAEALSKNARLNRTAQRRKPTGGYTTVNVPVTANQTLAEGEFNRFYIRALCRRAVEDNISDVVVYRAKEVANPRAESEQMIGNRIDPAALLADVREHVGVQTSTGFPGPNSGLCVRLP